MSQRILSKREIYQHIQTNNSETRDGFLKKIQINHNKKVIRLWNYIPKALSDATCNIRIILKSLQLSEADYTSQALTTSSSEDSEDLTNSFKQLLTAWIDSKKKGKDTNEQKIIERMEPLVYE